MNRTFPGRRRMLALLCSTAAAVGIGGLSASPALAAGPLPLSPTGTSVTIVNTHQPVGSDAEAGTAYWFRTTDASASFNERLQLVSGPATGTVSIAEYSSSTTVPLAADFGVASPLPSPTGASQVSDLLTTQNDYVALTADVPGDYVVRLYSDVVADGEYDSSQDAAAPTVTFHVKDVLQNTGATSDDWKPGITSPVTITKGSDLVSTIDFSGATLTDARGMTSGTGNLGTAILNATTVTLTDALGGTSNPATTLSGGTVTAKSATTVGSPPGTWSTTMTVNGGGTLASSSTTVIDNGVASLTSTAPAVTGTVAFDSGTGAVTVKDGVASVVYKAHVTLAAPGDSSDKEVDFTLTPSSPTSPVLTADGTLISTDSVTGAKDYRKRTNDSGDAFLRVTSSVTTAATTYQVDVASNGYSAAPPLVATYRAPAPASIKITSTPAQLTPVVGNSATISGQLLDQFGAMIAPPPSMSQQVSLFADANASASPCPSPGPGTPLQSVSVTSGAFGFSYTPATTPTAGQCSGFDIGYDATSNGSFADAEDVVTTGTHRVNFASAAVPAAITLTGLGGVSTFPVASTSTFPVQTLTGMATQTLTATVKDGSGTALPYASYTLTATPGIYFVDPSTGLYYATYSGVTDAAGVVNIEVALTKSGDGQRVVVNAGSVTVDTGAFTVDDPASSELYIASADDGMGEPGQFVSVTGKAVDAFGNNVPGAGISIATAADFFGNFLTTPPTVTDAGGKYSVTYVSGSDEHGTWHYTLTGTTALAQSDADNYTTLTGVALPAIQTTDTAAVEIGTPPLTLLGPGRLYGQGWLRLQGMTSPGASVDVYAKPWGVTGYRLIDTVTAHPDGIWTTRTAIDRTTMFLAKTSTRTSNTFTTTVFSLARLGASNAGMRHGYVRLGVGGNPMHVGTAHFVARVRGHWTMLATLRTSSRGTATWVWHTRPGRYQVVAQFTADGTVIGASPMGLVVVR